jgi:predicted PilT family ATPase
VDPKYHPKIIGRRGAVISKIRDQHEVNIQFPERGQESSQDIIKVMGYEANANAAKEDILKIVTELEQMITRDVKLDHRVHPRIIGQKGRQIRTIMNDFKVDIRFPGEGDPDPDIISITGAEENVLDCEEHLLNLNEEYIQDIRERELLDQYRRPSRTDAMEAKPKQAPFMVRDAPWDKKGAVVSPKLDSEEDFPGLGTSAAAAKTSAWGPWAGKR